MNKFYYIPIAFCLLALLQILHAAVLHWRANRINFAKPRVSKGQDGVACVGCGTSASDTNFHAIRRSILNSRPTANPTRAKNPSGRPPHNSSLPLASLLEVQQAVKRV
jgi:hypothetical protein